MDKKSTIGVTEDLKKGIELMKSVSDKSLDLLRPSARYFSLFKGEKKDTPDHEKGKYTLVRNAEDYQVGIYDKPLPCFGCGVGWFSVRVPTRMVLCNNYLFWKLLPQRSEGTSWPCCICDCCNGLHSRVVDHITCESTVTSIAPWIYLPRDLEEKIEQNISVLL